MIFLKFFKKRSDKKKNQSPLVKKNALLIKDDADMMEIKPNEGYLFFSNYFIRDGYYYSVMTLVHDDSKDDKFPLFWKTNLISNMLPKGCSMMLFEHVKRETDEWIEENKQRGASLVSRLENINGDNSDVSLNLKMSKLNRDIMDAFMDIQNGASYLNIKFRYIIKAPDLEALTKCVDILNTQFKGDLRSLSLQSFMGLQKSEFAKIFSFSHNKVDGGFYMSSTEYAGGYSVTTSGLNDGAGEYVGTMIGDYNNSVMLFDTNKYKKNVVLANDNKNRYDLNYTDMWCSLLSQSCLMSNHRVAHFVLNDIDLYDYGPKFDSITTFVDLSKQGINMFEVFGKVEDELSLYEPLSKKIRIMTLLFANALEMRDFNATFLMGLLGEVLEDFYVEGNFWYHNAQANRDKIRLVGLPHNQYPLLQKFAIYVDTAHKISLSEKVADEMKQHALNTLKLIYNQILMNNGDLFNVVTTKLIDNILQSRRIIYDFSDMVTRSRDIASAQFVNALSLTSHFLGKGDTIIIHGCEKLSQSPDFKNYVDATVLERFKHYGGRVVYSYNDIDFMLKDHNFCHFKLCDYSVLGNMTNSTVHDFENLLIETLPDSLRGHLTNKANDISYIRRGFDNIVFKPDLHLGLYKIKGGG